MKKNISLVVFITLVSFVAFSVVSGAEKKSQVKEDEIEKFRAHQQVEKLQNENFKKINLVEVISKNFGYTSYGKLKKDYWTARILVSKKQIIQAKELLEKNKKEIDEALKDISNDYQKATQEMLDECITKLNEFEFTANGDPNTNFETRNRIFILRTQIRMAVQQFDSANEALTDKYFVSSISLCRSAKSYTINILRDMAAPEEKSKVDDKYKIHIVDNRNEIYKKS
jgi:hypothetical protein